MKEPDETLITRWFDGELAGEELRMVEAWAEANPDWLERRASWQNLREDLRKAIPAELEVPNAEFFAHRINHELTLAEERATTEEKLSSSSTRFWLPVSAAAAALVVGFLGGTRMGPAESIGGSPSSEVTSAVLFSPDEEVEVELVDSSAATLILLKGVDDLPDSVDLVSAMTEGGPWFVGVGEDRGVN